MADSSEIQSKADAEIQRSQRDQQESSFLEAAVPIPDFFFNIKAEIEPIGGSKWRIRIFGYFLYILTLCVMFGSFAYYSLPAQRLSLESIVTSEWQKSGYVCKPLQKTTLHGLSTDWSYDECVSAVTNPSAENVVSVQKSDGSTQFDFKFALGGAVSFFDLRLETSVLQSNWKLDGRSCWPEAPYDTVKVFSSQPSSYYYYPFGFDKACYLRDLKIISGDDQLATRISSFGDVGAWGTDNTATAPFYCLFLRSVTKWETLMTKQDQYGGFGEELICATMKTNGSGFRCFDKPKPPATKELAIQRYASEYSPATICAPLKLNSPFQCTRNVEVPATTRLSLSVAAAQAVFALAGIALVALLRKLQKPSTKTSESLSTDGDLRSLVRKLRLTVDRLDSKVDHLGTGQGTHEELIQKLLSKEGGR